MERGDGIGASMTTRRALNAGVSAAWGLLFFVPLVNDLTMLVLAGLPTAARATSAPPRCSPSCAAPDERIAGCR